MLVDNPRYQYTYNAIAKFNKTNLYKSKEMELAKLDQLDKKQK